MLLTVSGTIANIVLKKALLSELTAESLRAFYGADAGADCAIYWDIFQESFDPYKDDSISCFGSVQNFTARTSARWTVISSVSWSFNFNVSGYCVLLSVSKSGVPTSTRIESRGINSCDTTDPRRVERAVRVTYGFI
jgi:hypothetical protein